MNKKIILITDSDIQTVLEYSQAESLWVSKEDKEEILYFIAGQYRRYLETKNRHMFEKTTDIIFRICITDMYGRIEKDVKMTATILAKEIKC